MTLLHTRRQTEGGIRGRRIRLDYNHLAIATFLFFSFLFNFDLPLNLSHLLISFYYCVIFWYCLSGSWFVDEICESSQWIRIRLEWPMLNDGCNKLGTEEFSGQFPFSYLFSPLFFFSSPLESCPLWTHLVCIHYLIPPWETGQSQLKTRETGQEIWPDAMQCGVLEAYAKNCFTHSFHLIDIFSMRNWQCDFSHHSCISFYYFYSFFLSLDTPLYKVLIYTANEDWIFWFFLFCCCLFCCLGMLWTLDNNVWIVLHIFTE